jgi:Fe-S oxidoreductase
MAVPINALTHANMLSTAIKKAGIDPHRSLPRFADHRFTRWFRRRAPHATGAPRGTVLLRPDTFTNNFDPAVARDAMTLLESAGFEVEFLGRPSAAD